MRNPALKEPPCHPRVGLHTHDSTFLTIRYVVLKKVGTFQDVEIRDASPHPHSHNLERSSALFHLVQSNELTYCPS